MLIKIPTQNLFNLALKYSETSSLPIFEKTPLFSSFSPSEKLNQFLILIKPELFEEKMKKEVLLERLSIILETLSNHQIQVHRGAFFNGSFCKRNQLIQKIYPILDQISQNGLIKCHRSAKKELNYFLSSSNTKVLGGAQFLVSYPRESSLSLRELNDQIGAKKFGSGVYGIETKVNDTSLLVLNAFFPKMVEDFNTESASFLALNCSSLKSWNYLREQAIGYINPKKAASSSLRNLVYHFPSRLKPKIFDISHNGFHISPGPLEACMQLKAIFGKSEKYNFENLFSGYSELDLCGLFEGFELGEIYQKTENLNTLCAIKEITEKMVKIT